MWGVSSSGQGIGVRGNGRQGIQGEGTHTGVAGDGFIGVRGTTSGIEAVAIDPAAGAFTIFLTAAPDVDVPIGWLALS